MDKTKTYVMAGALALTLASGGLALAANAGSGGDNQVGNLAPAASTSTSSVETPSSSTSSLVDVPEPTSKLGEDRVTPEPGDDNSARPAATTGPSAVSPRRTFTPDNPRPATATTDTSSSASDDGSGHGASDDGAVDDD
jgi:hypothetical protein